MSALISPSADPSPDRTVRENLLLAYARHAAGRFDEAEAIARTVLGRDPRNAPALHLIGEVALRRGEIDAALQFVGRAISAQPRFAEAHNTLGAALKAAGRIDEAAKEYRTAIRLKPGFADAHNNAGELLIAQGRFEEATIPLRNALRADPAHFRALNNLGTALFRLDRLDEAVALLERAVALRPDFAIAWTNLGNARRALGQADRAAVAHARAVALVPDRAEHRLNHGNTLRELGDMAGAIDAFRRALALAPDSAAAHNNLGGALLASEVWAEGWAEFEWRWHLGDNPALRARYPFPLWSGEDLAGRSVLLWPEQGIGDIVLFATMLPDLIETGARITLELEPRLVPLFARSFPAITVLPAGAVSTDAIFDYQANLGRLGPFLRNHADAFARNRPYLLADPARRAAFRARYEALGAGPKIGLAWRSTSPTHRRKSLALDAFAPLFAARPDAVFVSLQYGDTAAERAQARQRFGAEIHHDDSFDNWTDLDGLAAQIAALDHVVTVSNLNAHFAGALDVPAHVLLTQNTLWYWPHAKPTTPWYKNLTLVRTGTGAAEALMQIADTIPKAAS